MTVLVALGLSAGATACGRPVDLSAILQVRPVWSGWIDAGVVDGKHKIVPTVSLTVKNGASRPLPVLQINALFGRVGDEDEWGASLVTVAGSEGLAPGASSAVTVTSPLGYTGVEPRAMMLANSQFVDARVDLFAKYGSTQWTRIGRYRVSRDLLAR